MLGWLFPEEPPRCVCGYFGNEGTMDRHLAHPNNQNRAHHRLAGSTEAAPLTKCPINCPKGHPLQPFFTPGGRCDGRGCSEYCTKGTPVLDCRSCNWYLCIACQTIITNEREQQRSELPLQIPRAEADERVKQEAQQQDQQPLASQLRQRVVPRAKEGSDLPPAVQLAARPKLLPFPGSMEAADSISLGAAAAASRWHQRDYLLLLLLTVLAFASRFHNLEYPNSAVYDETHIGRFVNGYRCGSCLLTLCLTLCLRTPLSVGQALLCGDLWLVHWLVHWLALCLALCLTLFLVLETVSARTALRVCQHWSVLRLTPY